MLYLVMSECCNLTSFVVITVVAISALCSLCGASGSSCFCPSSVRVSSCRNLNVGCVVATSTSLIRVPTVLGASCILCRVLNLIVSECCNLTSFVVVAVVAIFALLTLRGANRCSCFCPITVDVSCCRNYKRVKNVFVCIEVLTTNRTLVMSESSFALAGRGNFINPSSVGEIGRASCRERVCLRV